ncbi:MAG TPA: NrfD/PsrC family molybdoenzyme membrane anchor subunit [Armatimonadota bacterium]|jgi:molybdopterin-containing oxidoreductase family membrane subunit
MPEFTYREINQEIMQALSRPTRRYFLVLACLALGLGAGLLTFLYQTLVGMGVTGLNVPVGWTPYITNFVFWIGIGHAGTLLSAILYLFRVEWRNAVYRAAETMTVFAVATAAMFPLIHLGRVWVFYWLLPYPNQRHLWPNFKSPLMWDVVAVTTYFVVSVLFLYMGLIPDLAALRDASTGWRKRLYARFALGWDGNHHQWRHYLRAYMGLACLATPLVISVHSVVSWDFAMALLPGWHETIFAPYFVAGAIHSGLAMVITLLIPLRKILRLERLIEVRHLAALAGLNILTALIIGYAYAVEPFMAWYSGDAAERSYSAFRAFGPYAPYYWIMLVCNVALPLLYSFRRVRESLPWLLGISLLINVGMWLERYVILVTPLAHGFLPSSRGLYTPQWVEIAISLASGCLFLLGFLVAVRLFPIVAIAENKPLPAPPPEVV